MIRLPQASGSCSGGGGKREHGLVERGIWKLDVHHGEKPLVAWEPVGNICKYSRPTFKIVLLLAAYLCEWRALWKTQSAAQTWQEKFFSAKKCHWEFHF